ncbi:sortase [Thermoactinomyces sp. DSM 45892]|uniref:sortase n=1 Tax=Thermoactinomyces sp. DSM 45892 TaxID=1882753 RepID=UPI0008961300|nr:sortase [Thermoactinomyces sp. DSM 45892]SDZ20076.1 sortase A [Thermoactinomyces sp. DSM 45892]
MSKIDKQGNDTSPQPALAKGIPSDLKHNRGDMIAKLSIPRLKKTLEVVYGADSNSLEKGVGSYIEDNDPKTDDKTVKPGETGHVVLSGHRDTKFRGMGELKVGDPLIIDYNNHLFIYQVRKMRVTSKEDRTVIVTKDKPILTLVTCHPFNMLGSAPNRYIIESELIEIRNK